MSKRQHGNKEAKKPKQPVPAKPPPVAANTLDAAVVAPRQKR